LFGEGTKDEDRAESCDPSPEHEPETQLDGPDENACFTPPINFFILHSICNNNTQQQVPSTLGVSVSVSGWKETKGCVERLQAMMLARKLPYFNTTTLTLNLANLEHGEGFRDFPIILFQSFFYLFIFLKFLIL
jgi:hypothetical protein